jgi:hypothetical protein
MQYGKRHGKGKIYFYLGDSFEGEFNQDEFVSGTYAYKEGHKYVGGFKGYMKEGFAKEWDS